MKNTIRITQDLSKLYNITEEQTDNYIRRIGKKYNGDTRFITLIHMLYSVPEFIDIYDVNIYLNYIDFFIEQHSNNFLYNNINSTNIDQLYNIFCDHFYKFIVYYDIAQKLNDM